MTTRVTHRFTAEQMAHLVNIVETAPTVGDANVNVTVQAHRYLMGDEAWEAQTEDNAVSYSDYVIPKVQSEAIFEAIFERSQQLGGVPGVNGILGAWFNYGPSAADQ